MSEPEPEPGVEPSGNDGSRVGRVLSRRNMVVASVSFLICGGVGGLSYSVIREDMDNDKKNLDALNTFGSRGRVLQILGESKFRTVNANGRPVYHSAWRCVVENEREEKDVVWFFSDTPVVEGETWEIKYHEDYNICYLSKQVPEQEEAGN